MRDAGAEDRRASGAGTGAPAGRGRSSPIDTTGGPVRRPCRPSRSGRRDAAATASRPLGVLVPGDRARRQRGWPWAGRAAACVLDRAPPPARVVRRPRGSRVGAPAATSRSASSSLATTGAWNVIASSSGRPNPSSRVGKSTTRGVLVAPPQRRVVAAPRIQTARPRARASSSASRTGAVGAGVGPDHHEREARRAGPGPQRGERAEVLAG